MDLLVIYHLYRSVILNFVLLVYQQQKDVAALVELYDQYKLEIDLMKQALKRNKTHGNVSSAQMKKEVIELVEQLYKISMQQKSNQIHDQIINLLPQSSSSCSLFQELKTILQKQ